jgi:hypothetical protein
MDLEGIYDRCLSTTRTATGLNVVTRPDVVCRCRVSVAPSVGLGFISMLANALVMLLAIACGPPPRLLGQTGRRSRPRSAASGPRLPTWAVQQVGSYLGYTGRDVDVVMTAAHDPEPPRITSSLNTPARKWQ